VRLKYEADDMRDNSVIDVEVGGEMRGHVK
jgi:hypothetical protein